MRNNSQSVRASKRFTREEETRRGEKSFRLDMEDVGLWLAYEAQALMYNPAPDNHQTASVADSPACTPQQSSFLPCWNESWLHAPRGPHEEIHDVSTLVSRPSLLVDTVSFEQRHNQQFIQAVSSSSSSSPELLQNIVVPCTGSDGLWQLPHHSTSGGSSLLASELYSCSSVGDDHSELHKSTTQVGHFSNMSMARTSNSDFQSGYNNDKLLIQPATPGAASAAAAAAGGGAMMMSTRTHQFSGGTVPQVQETTAGGSVRRDSCLDELLQNPHKLYQLPVVVPEKIQIAAMMDPRFSPRGNGAAAATMNVQQENLPRQTGVAAAGGMKSMASFNPGPYVSSSRSAAAPAVGERQEHGILAAHKTWFENKPGNNTTAPNNMPGFDQLGGSSAQRIVASQQQQMVVRPQSLGNEWPSRRMMSSIPAVPLPAPWLKPLVDERTSSIVIMQPEAAAGTTTALKCTLPRCPSPAAAASSGSTVAFINSRKRSMLQGDSFEGSFQNIGKKPVAGGGVPWSDQDGCSRLEFLSTAAHKQVSQSTASGSRALGPALNTNLKPRARQGSANDPQSIAARVRRERISERLKYLQALIPNGDKVDMVTMLEKAINYVQCLELQIRMLKDDSVWPKALGALPTTFHELLEIAGPEFAGSGQSKADVAESKPKISAESIGEDPANPPPLTHTKH